MCKQDGHCLLHIASQEGHNRIVEILLQAGATVDLQNKVEKLFIRVSLVVCHAQYSLFTKYHTTFRGIRSFSGLGTCFPKKFDLKMLAWNQNSSEFF